MSRGKENVLTVWGRSLSGVLAFVLGQRRFPSRVVGRKLVSIDARSFLFV